MPNHWRTIGESVVGSSHAKSVVSCQDAHCWQTTIGGLWIGAVADGAGSASHSGLGATLVTQLVVQDLAQSLECASLPLDEAEWQMRFSNAFLEIRCRLNAFALAQDIPLAELASTLLVVVAGVGFAAAAQVGDGAIVLGGLEGEVFTLIPPQRSEYANVTTFLTSLDFLEQTRFALWNGPLAHVAILSDGLQFIALRMPEGEAHAPFFEPMFRYFGGSQDRPVSSANLTAFLDSARVREKSDDDLTLLLASLIPIIDGPENGPDFITF